jgi:hypothetical protein
VADSFEVGRREAVIGGSCEVKECRRGVCVGGDIGSMASFSLGSFAFSFTPNRTRSAHVGTSSTVDFAAMEELSVVARLCLRGRNT